VVLYAPDRIWAPFRGRYGPDDVLRHSWVTGHLYFAAYGPTKEVAEKHPGVPKGRLNIP
jgi:hypothetical protein